MTTRTTLRGRSTATKLQGIGCSRHFGDETLSVDGDNACFGAPRANGTGNVGNHGGEGRKGTGAAKGRQVSGAGKGTVTPSNQGWQNPSSVSSFGEEVPCRLLHPPTTTVAGHPPDVLCPKVCHSYSKLFLVIELVFKIEKK